MPVVQFEGITDTRFDIHGLIGKGGSGSVYQAIDRTTTRRIALKVLTDPNAVSRSRFEREARTLHAIQHPNVCAGYEYGRLDDGRPFVVMELLAGNTLRSLLTEHGPLTIEAAIEITAQLLSGLDIAHGMSVIHRDVKPENVFLVRDRAGRLQVKLLDFGLCRSAADPYDGRTLTKGGCVVGTPGYLAPEQITGDMTIDHRVDIFTAGLVLWEMLAGRAVYRGKNAAQLVASLLTYEVPSVKMIAPRVPDELNRVLLKATERDPNARYAKANEFLHDLLEARTEIRRPAA